MATATPATKVVTGEVRCSYVHLTEPWANSDNPNAIPKFSIAILIPKSDTATVEKLRAAQENAKKIGKDKKWGGEIPHNLKDTLHDGDVEADLKKNPEYAGHWYMTVSNTQRPGIVDSDLQQIIDPTQLYSGMYARVSLNAYPYNTAGNRGVSFSLNNVMKKREGEALAGSASAESDFAEFADDLL